MAFVFITILVLAGVALAAFGVLSFFQSGASKARSDNKSLTAQLADSNERVAIAQTALIQIASGDALPVLRASDALAQITQSYSKEIK